MKKQIILSIIALLTVSMSAIAQSLQTFTVKGISFKMVYVQSGTFMMGSNDYAEEKPIHKVSLSSFSIGQTEVTQELWEAVMNTNPSYDKGPKLPVGNVSWNDCQIFISKLNAITGKKFRLPTEAEWEYAARGGNNSKGYKYSGSNNVNDVAWWSLNSGSKPHNVGSKRPNELGIYDMSGNMWEWCQDWFGEKYYSSSPSTNPTGPKSGKQRVTRGGTYRANDGFCIMSVRGKGYPQYSDLNQGLRLAL